MIGGGDGGGFLHPSGWGGGCGAILSPHPAGCGGGALTVFTPFGVVEVAFVVAMSCGVPTGGGVGSTAGCVAP